MTSWITRLVAVAVLGISCAAGEEAPIVVGAVVSQTGAHAAPAEGYRKGLLAWEAEINAAGGLLGRPVSLRLLDDGSSAARAGAQYEKLIAAGTDLLIGPYGSAATLLAAAAAERAQRVLVNGAGPAGAVHKSEPKFVFQSAPPYAAYGDGVLTIAKDAGMKSLFLLARDDPPSREMAEAARAQARGQGFGSVRLVFYSGGTADFAPQVAAARAMQADAWIAFGETRDAADMVRTFKRLDYAPPLFFASAASDPKFLELVGQDAELTLTSLEYHPRLGTLGNRAFANAYAARWKVQPGLAAAQGYAAATVLESAVRHAGSLDQQAVRAALAKLEIPTVLGPSRGNAKNGSQAGIRPPVAQIVRGTPEVVWPAELASAAPLPYPAWRERVLLK